MDKKSSNNADRASQNDNNRRNPEAENVKKAHTQADKDIASDAELSAHSPNDDLDEGESARLGEDKNGLV
jgi:hypothetical protein